MVCEPTGRSGQPSKGSSAWGLQDATGFLREREKMSASSNKELSRFDDELPSKRRWLCWCCPDARTDCGGISSRYTLVHTPQRPLEGGIGDTEWTDGLLYYGPALHLLQILLHMHTPSHPSKQPQHSADEMDLVAWFSCGHDPEVECDCHINLLLPSICTMRHQN